ncbi:MAG TPA: hypothetical protein VM578_12105 [Candidatus Saccharimonadales bacterium]|nr:hypothetical protein [Candidatus Saccharimonadales bacterium]
MDLSPLGQFLAEHSAVQALAAVLVSQLWTLDDAGDSKQSTFWIRISWWAIGTTILIIFAAGFIQDKQWIALLIATAGILLQFTRMFKLLVKGSSKPT